MGEKRHKPHLKLLIFKDFKPTNSKLVRTDLATCLGSLHARIVEIDARDIHTRNSGKLNKGKAFAGCKEAQRSSDLLQLLAGSYWHLAEWNLSHWSCSGRGTQERLWGGRSWTKVGQKRSWQESSPRKVKAGKHQETSVQKGRWLKGLSTTSTTWGNNKSFKTCTSTSIQYHSRHLV